VIVAIYRGGLPGSDSHDRSFECDHEAVFPVLAYIRRNDRLAMMPNPNGEAGSRNVPSNDRITHLDPTHSKILPTADDDCV
jgi:hypothetical protein